MLLSFKGHTVNGDVHNFGRRVTPLTSQWIKKPRPVLWEQLFLSAASPLRASLSEVFAQEKSIDPFKVIPDLKFFTLQVPNSGFVEKVRVEEIGRFDKFREGELEVIGAFIAIICWFGISDLHDENVIIGRDQLGNLIIAPIDIECIFQDFKTPSQSGLLPGLRSDIIKYGLIPFFKDIEHIRASDIGKLIFSYYKSICILEKNKTIIFDKLLKIPHISETPIRVIFRPTRFYVEKVKERDFRNIFASETIQLDRRDIPYFFAT